MTEETSSPSDEFMQMAENEMLNEAWERGDAVHCMACGKPVMIDEAVYADDYDEDTACHSGCIHQAKLNAASGGTHPDEEHRLLHSEYGFSK